MAPKRVKEKLPACGFVVTLNAKDESLPVKIKKVAKGKKLSVLSGITGSRAAAVTTLKQLLGVGGEVSEEVGDGIELQGDQSGRLLTILRNLGALRGETSSSSISFTVKADNGIETFMKRKDAVKIVASVSLEKYEEMSKACILVHGRYWPYCNGACVYCPPLTDVFEGLDMFCSWFEQPAIVYNKQDEKSIEKMSDAELNKALSVLGMKAEVGQACRDYERQKSLRVSIPFVSKEKEVMLLSSSVPPTPPRRGPQKRAVKFVDKPVRVILNRCASNSAKEDYFVMEVSLLDPAQWMKDYEYFLVSLLRETNVELANHELEDSRRLLLFFYTRVSMDECKTVLDEVMPDFFAITFTDASLSPAEEELKDYISSEESLATGSVDFEKMAREFGVDNEIFWEKFTLCIEDSDGSQEGLMIAFQKALLEVT